MFLQKIVIGIALSSVIAPGVSQVTKVTNHEIQLNKIKQAKKTVTKIPGVPNMWTIYEQTDYIFYLVVTLGNSDYNGFSGFLDQINTKGYDGKIRSFFFQWIDNNQFHTGHFPDLNDYTNHGFWHPPFDFNDGLEFHMGNFGAWSEGFSETAYHMIFNLDNTFFENAEHDYLNTSNTTGIAFSFKFAFKWQGLLPKYGDLGHQYDVLSPL